jgi:hypothetical protein
MQTFISLVIFCQGLGAFLGAGATVWGELAYMWAMRDGHISVAERRHLRVIGHGLRWGMTLLLLSSLTLVVIAYLLQFKTQPAVTAGFWVLMCLALVVIYASWSLSRKKISYALGSALAFTGWWFLVYLVIGSIPALSFGAMVGFFIVATGIFYAILSYARLLLYGTHAGVAR